MIPQPCPICNRLKYLIRYHITYSPERIIYACQDCNELEWKMRNNMLSFHPIIKYRIRKLYKEQGFRAKPMIKMIFKTIIVLTIIVIILAAIIANTYL